LSDPLRIAALAKQIPVAEDLRLGDDGRLVRHGLELEMNAFCRRAVSKGVELARTSGGTCTVFTLGPPSADDVLREAVAWGADSGVHLCDDVFAGSDTLATARALSAALTRYGPFDLILVGRNSLDGETGQVGPEVAQLLELPFASGVRVLEMDGRTMDAELEIDDGTLSVRLDLPALISVAERLCEPCKVDPSGRAAVPPERITLLPAAMLGDGPWGEAGSPTVVGAVRPMVHDRERHVLRGALEAQVGEAIEILRSRGALTPDPPPGVPSPAAPSNDPAVPPETSSGPVVAVVVEQDRLPAGLELLGAAAGLARSLGGSVVALSPGNCAVEDLAGAGANEVVELTGSRVADDVARAVIDWAADVQPWAILVPSTAFGREVAARAAAALEAGLVGDAIALRVEQGRLVAAKPAFAGALVADITCRSALQLATVRPGVLPLPEATMRGTSVRRSTRPVDTRGRLQVLAERRNDDIEALARAQVVIGVGTGVHPDEYEQLSPLAAVLGAELAATRKVTDKGWAPRSRQVGITGRAVAPRLYVAIGLSGKFNHMVGVRSAGTILAVNPDPSAPVFEHCDVGIVADWHEVVPLLTTSLRQRQPTAP
jgi:electron transfer flavoprotein alpha subunit